MTATYAIGEYEFSTTGVLDRFNGLLGKVVGIGADRYRSADQFERVAGVGANR